MSGLVEACDDHIRKRLTFRNGLELLEQAHAFRGGEDFKKQLHLVIKNRHAFILTSDDLGSLGVSDLVDLIRLYRGVKTDFIIRAIHIWGRDMEKAKFQEVFRDVLYRHINWDNLSNSAMLDLHKAGTLPMEMEHEAMLAILSRTYPLPTDEQETVSTVNWRLWLCRKLFNSCFSDLRFGPPRIEGFSLFGLQASCSVTLSLVELGLFPSMFPELVSHTYRSHSRKYMFCKENIFQNLLASWHSSSMT